MYPDTKGEHALLIISVNWSIDFVFDNLKQRKLESHDEEENYKMREKEIKLGLSADFLKGYYLGVPR